MPDVPHVWSINRVQDNNACKVNVRSTFLEEEISNPTKSRSNSLISGILFVLCKYLYVFFRIWSVSNNALHLIFHAFLLTLFLLLIHNIGIKSIFRDGLWVFMVVPSLLHLVINFLWSINEPQEFDDVHLLLLFVPGLSWSLLEWTVLTFFNFKCFNF